MVISPSKQRRNSEKERVFFPFLFFPLGKNWGWKMIFFFLLLLLCRGGGAGGGLIQSGEVDVTEELGDGGDDWAIVLLVVVELEERNGEKFEVFWDSKRTLFWLGV